MATVEELEAQVADLTTQLAAMTSAKDNLQTTLSSVAVALGSFADGVPVQRGAELFAEAYAAVKSENTTLKQAVAAWSAE